MNPKTKLTAEEFAALGDQTVSLRDLYAQQGDAYVLAAEAVGDFKLANVSGLQNTIKTVRGEADAFKLKLKPFEDLLAEREIDLDGLSALLAKADAAGDNAAVESRIAEQVERAKKAMQKQLDEAKAAAEASKSKLRTHYHDNALMKAIVEEGGDPELIEPYLRMQTKPFETADGGFDVFAFDERGEERWTDDRSAKITPRMLLQSLKAKPNWKHAFKAETIDAPEGGDGHSGGGRGDGFNFESALKNPGAAFSSV